MRWAEEQEILETQAAEAGGPGPGEPAPDGAAATDELEDEDSGAAGLAPGWTEHFDEETGCYFFYHEEKVLQQFSAC